jgi:outer membrane protein assembly factor BamB
VIYFGTGNHDFQALNAADGSPFWKSAPLAGAFEHGPAVYANEMSNMPLRNRTIYVGAGGYLYALNAASGKPSWKQWIGSGDGSIPAVSTDGESIYVGGGGNALYAFSTSTGSPRWKHPFPLRGPVQNQPAVSHQVIYFASGDNLYAVNANGTPYWRPHDFGAPVTGLVVANGSVYLGAGNSIYCLDDTTGKQCQGWHSYKATSLVTAPVLANGRIYFGTLDGKVYVLSSQGSLVRLTSYRANLGGRRATGRQELGVD